MLDPSKFEFKKLVRIIAFVFGFIRKLKSSVSKKSNESTEKVLFSSTRSGSLVALFTEKPRVEIYIQSPEIAKLREKLVKQWASRKSQ